MTDGLLQFEVGIGDLESLSGLMRQIGNQAPNAIRRALNWTGDKARTKVVRALARQTGTKYATVRRALLTRRANYGAMAYRIVAFGGFLSLKEFAPRQRRDGVSAAPWGKRVVFKHAFISTAMGGNVFVREMGGTGRVPRLPVRQLWGPALPRELLKGETQKLFETTVSAELQPRVVHEVEALIRGYVPR